MIIYPTRHPIVQLQSCPLAHSLKTVIRPLSNPCLLEISLAWGISILGKDNQTPRRTHKTEQCQGQSHVKHESYWISFLDLMKIIQNQTTESPCNTRWRVVSLCEGPRLQVWQSTCNVRSSWAQITGQTEHLLFWSNPRW